MTDPILATEGLSKSFGALKATQALSIDLRPGALHALIGPNGAGKSTLIKQIAGGLKPDSGRVYLAGQDVTALPTPVRARLGLGRPFQVSALAMEDTVLQTAVLGALGAEGNPVRLFRPALGDRALRAAAEDALERVGLSDHRATRTAELSHGQRRLLRVEGLRRQQATGLQQHPRPVRTGDRAADQARVPPLHRQRHARAAAKSDDPGRLLRRRGPRNGPGAPAPLAAPVGEVGGHLGRVGDQTRVAQNGCER